MVGLVARPFEALQDIDDRFESGLFQRVSGRQRTMAATTDEEYRSGQVAAYQSPDVIDKVRLDQPVRRLLPGNMLGAQRMPDIEVLDPGPAIDENSIRLAQEQIVSGAGVEVLHVGIRKSSKLAIMKADSQSREPGP